MFYLLLDHDLCQIPSNSTAWLRTAVVLEKQVQMSQQSSSPRDTPQSSQEQRSSSDSGGVADHKLAPEYACDKFKQVNDLSDLIHLVCSKGDFPLLQSHTVTDSLSEDNATIAELYEVLESTPVPCESAFCRILNNSVRITKRHWLIRTSDDSVRSRLKMVACSARNVPMHSR